MESIQWITTFVGVKDLGLQLQNKMLKYNMQKRKDLGPLLQLPKMEIHNGDDKVIVLFTSHMYLFLLALRLHLLIDLINNSLFR